MGYFSDYIEGFPDVPVQDNDFFDAIVKLIFTELDRIEVSKISEDSLLEIEDSLFTLRFFSNNKNCPIFFRVYTNVVNIQLDHGAEYLYVFPINSYSDLEKLNTTLLDLLSNEIVEEVYYKDDRVVGVKYSVPYRHNGEVKQYVFSTGSTFIPFWSTRYKETTIYDSWL